MSRVTSFAASPRRFVPIAAAVLLALLVAFALIVEPPASDHRSAPDTAVAPAADPAMTETGRMDDATAPVDGDAPNDVRAAKSLTESDGVASAGGVAAPATAPVAATADEATSTIAAPELDAKIIRTGSLQLKVKRGTFEDAWGDAQSVAGSFGGYVLTASRSGAGKGPRYGTITMRVPSGRFDAALDRLRDTSHAKVERLDVSSQDVSQEYVDTKSRLRHDRAVEGRLLALLARTETVSEVLAVQARLDQVQEQIEVSKGRIAYLDKMTAMSTIELTLREPGAHSTPKQAQERSTLARSFDDAVERFVGNIGAAMVWFGGALPVLAAIAFAAFVGRRWWRRRQVDAVGTGDAGRDVA